MDDLESGMSKTLRGREPGKAGQLWRVDSTAVAQYASTGASVQLSALRSQNASLFLESRPRTLGAKFNLLCILHSLSAIDTCTYMDVHIPHGQLFVGDSFCFLASCFFKPSLIGGQI